MKEGEGNSLTKESLWSCAVVESFVLPMILGNGFEVLLFEVLWVVELFGSVYGLILMMSVFTLDMVLLALMLPLPLAAV